MRIWFHGTNADAAIEIFKTGFREGTYFAKHLEDALEFGGPHIFEAVLLTDHVDWQISVSNQIPPESIVRYSVYERTILKDFPERRAEVFRGNMAPTSSHAPPTSSEPPAQKSPPPAPAP